MKKSESTLQALASVLRASPESDALVTLGRLLDSLPIGFHVSDCGGAFHVLYANSVTLVLALVILILKLRYP